MAYYLNPKKLCLLFFSTSAESFENHFCLHCTAMYEPQIYELNQIRASSSLPRISAAPTEASALGSCLSLSSTIINREFRKVCEKFAVQITENRNKLLTSGWHMIAFFRVVSSIQTLWGGRTRDRKVTELVRLKKREFWITDRKSDTWKRNSLEWRKLRKWWHDTIKTQNS